ncbi:hypothetical protein ACS15_4426 [Ralstonia insidiosa]|uniref:Integrase n=1 Tax=Ralstonia insidiosa TaxID=190721 RepID=A0AAC9FTU7_9RALS|nr:MULTISPECIES: hypothetical protein [Ralstonia]ANH76164.1 hypothetical protein ACS15_4426 [Ralstonia insidiosa]EPX94555.1 hypothetical protein C404_28150 [Ralstonia sp. AU12-08]
MNAGYRAYVDLGHTLAEQRGLCWLLPLEPDGRVTEGHAWNLNELAGDVLPPKYYLSHLGRDPQMLQTMALQSPALSAAPLSVAWQDLIKAATLEHLLVKRNTTGYIAGSIVRPLRVLATCVSDKEPWQLTVEDGSRAIQLASGLQASGKLGALVESVLRNLFDVHQLADAGPVYCGVLQPRSPLTRRRAAFLKSQDELSDSLEQRKRSERLPERRAFWELVRIVMTEPPRSYIDTLRFLCLRMMIVTGLRIGEAVLLPADWQRTRVYYDRQGRPAGVQGGYADALMLRHFAEKQQTKESDSRVLFEKAQYVPEMFRELLTETLQRSLDLTEPLRRTLRLQTEMGRLLPWYAQHEVVPATQLYPHLTGNPFWAAMDSDRRAELMERYRVRFDAAVFRDIQEQQRASYAQRASLDMAAYVYLNRLEETMHQGSHTLSFRLPDGSVVPPGRRIAWEQTYLHVGELEAYLRVAVPTKLSDTEALPLATGTLQSWELLFLTPKRSLVEERADGLCDVTRVMAVNRPDGKLVANAIGQPPTSASLFRRYGQSPEDKQLSIESHMLRHLQNTELFRLGVADTIISKRFNRRSVAQSYEYDHRSLAEQLDQIELPLEVELSLGEKASTVAKMILGGKASGPIVASFLRIQADEGDEAAFAYLRAEADGFHATPYGHCLNSFTVDPCPKHLECFAGCRHLSATNLPENHAHLIRLEGKLVAALEHAQARPATTPGRDNQISHARVRLDGVRKLLATADGERPFPDGPDLSVPSPRGVLDD